MKINSVIFFIGYFFILLIQYLVLIKKKKDNKKFVKCSFILYLLFLIPLLFFLQNIYNYKYLVFNFTKENFSIDYMFNTSINIRPFYILNYVRHKPTFFGFIFNIICFIPLGMYLPLFIKRKKSRLLIILLVIVSISLLIEILQFILPVNRVADIDDVIANTFGALMGYTILKLFSIKKQLL